MAKFSVYELNERLFYFFKMFKKKLNVILKEL